MIPFLTLEDPNAKIKGSRDPLALQPVWAKFARHFVTNLTTVTSSVRGFTVLLLGRYLGERLIQSGRAERGDALSIFLRVEQLCAYARHAGHGAEDVRGIERVKRFLEEEKRRPYIHDDPRGLILSDQKVYGLWGLFSVSARVSGLIPDGPVGVEPETRRFIEDNYVPHWAHAEDHFLRLAERGGRLKVNRRDPLFRGLVDALPEDLTSQERGFYAEYLRDATHVKHAVPGRQALLARLIVDHADPDAAVGRAEVLALSRAAEEDDPELASRLARAARIEALFAPAAALFEFLLSRPDQHPREVAAAVTDVWGSSVPNLTAQPFAELLGEFREVAGPEITREAERTREALATGDYAAGIEALLEWNRLVMSNRGSAPWARIGENGRIDVRYRGDEALLPSGDELPVLWRNSYFLDSLKVIAYQLEPAR